VNDHVYEIVSKLFEAAELLVAFLYLVSFVDGVPGGSLPALEPLSTEMVSDVIDTTNLESLDLYP